jgi:hypothetical protein
MSEALTATEATPAAPDGAVVVSGAQDAPAAVPAAGEAPAASGTLLGSDPVEKPVVAPADWPEDWAQKLAGADPKELARVQRMASPAAVWKAYRELEAKLSSGQYKQGLKPDATPEEVATWRKENGLPESPEGYKPALPNGMIPGEVDAPLIGGFQKLAHEQGLTPDQFNKTLAWYYNEVDADAAQRVENDKAFRATAEDQLRAEWGPQYRAEVKGIANFLEASAPAGLSDVLFNSRTADGKLLGDHPEVLRWLSGMVRTVNPLATLVPAGSADPLKAGEARIAEIEGVMKADQRKYWNDPALQEEYGKLLQARNAMQGRAA